MKLHYLKHTLVRRNLIQDTVDCFGLWVDHSIHNTRITQNILADSDKAAFYLEASYGPNLVDQNIFWGGNSDGILLQHTGNATIAHPQPRGRQCVLRVRIARAENPCRDEQRVGPQLVPQPLGRNAV